MNKKVGTGKFVPTDKVFGTCHKCNAPMTPHTCGEGLQPGEVTYDWDVWCCCTEHSDNCKFIKVF